MKMRLHSQWTDTNIQKIKGSWQHYTKLASAIDETRKHHKSITVCWLDLLIFNHNSIPVCCRSFNAFGSVHHQLTSLLDITMPQISLSNWLTISTLISLPSFLQRPGPRWLLHSKSMFFKGILYQQRFSTWWRYYKAPPYISGQPLLTILVSYDTPMTLASSAPVLILSLLVAWVRKSLLLKNSLFGSCVVIFISLTTRGLQENTQKR